MLHVPVKYGCSHAVDVVSCYRCRSEQLLRVDPGVLV